MREIGAEPYVAVNTGLGGAARRGRARPVRQRRRDDADGPAPAENGRPAPFGVKLWAIGNEMYGDWQIGHMPLAKYVAKHREVVDAMRAEDPKIQPVAVGAARRVEPDRCSQDASSHMSYISEHVYWQNKPDVPAHVAQARDGIRQVAEAHRAYRREHQGARGQGRPDRARRVELLVRRATSTASSARATSSRTASGSPRGSTSSSATATSS